MAKIPTDQAGEFHLRPGVSPFEGTGWRGVNTEDDPGSLDPNELQRAQNVRIQGRKIVTRRSLTQAVDFGLAFNSEQNHVLYMHPAPVDNPRSRMWLTAHGCFGTTIGTGASLFHLDPAAFPVLHRYADFFTDANFQSPLGKYGGRLFLGDRGNLREVVIVTPPQRVASNEFLFSPMAVPVAAFDGYTIRCMLEFDAKLFIGIENNADPATSKIVVWNGLSVQDDLTGVRPPQCMGIWRNKLVAGFDATAAHVRYRDAGAAPGTWTTVALAGFLASFNGNAMAEHKQYLYIASGNDLIHRFDGTALSLVRTIAGAAVDGSGCTALAVHNGLLYYGWNTPGAAYASRIGRFDPESTAANEWVDTYKDVTTEQASFKQLVSMSTYRNQIYVGGQQLWVLATKIDDVKGTLQVLNNTGAPSAGSQVRQLLRFP